MRSLALEPIFDSWPLMLLLAAVLMGVPFLVAIHGDQIDARRRRILTWLRLASAALLLIAAIRPALLSTDSLPTRATLAVLLDQSRSMTLPAEDGRTRWDVQNEVWRSLAPAIEQLDESLDLRVLGYSDEVVELTPAQIAAGATSSGRDSEQGREGSSQHAPHGTATDLAAALSGSLRVAAGQPLAGVVLIGDGVHNPPRLQSTAGDPAGPTMSRPTAQSDPQSVARTLASLDVPLWSIGIGPPGDAGQVRDVEVDELAQSLNVFAGNEFDVDFVIRSRALQGVEMPIRVRLSSESDPGNAVEVATRRFTPARAIDSASITIPLIAPEPGSYRLEVAVDPQEGETLLANNSQFAFVDVREGGGRILYLEGQPRPEQTFIRRALRRFPDLELTYRWIAEDGLANWPVDLGDALRPGRFDVYLIGDLPAEALGSEQLAALAAAVEAGSGLLAIGGLKAFDAGGYGQSPLAAVLPIQMNRAGGNDVTGLEGMIRPRLTAPHPITTLEPADPALAAQQSVWDSLPPLVGANRFGDVRVAPGINVLLETPDANPLLVVGEYGRGRVVAFAGDSTWRWWRQGEDVAHRRFWRQTILWLLDRGDPSDVEIIVELPERRFERGYAAPWRVSHTSPTPGVGLDLQIVAADGSLIELQPAVSEIRRNENQSAEGPGTAILDGTMPVLPPGLYQLQAAISGTETAVEKSFQVLDNDRELARPFADLTYLAQLSAQTAASGGASFLPSQVDELIQQITELRRTSASPVVKKYRLGDTPTTAWPLFLLIVGLLSTEWVLRRRWGLV
jgi:hypothetical protein